MKHIRANPVVVLRGVPVLMILGGAAADLFGPEPYLGLPFLASAPLVASVLLHWRTSVVTAAVVGVVVVGVDLQLRRPAPALLVDLAIVVLVSVIGLWAKWLMDRQSRHLAVTQDIAEAAQRAVLPDPPTRLGLRPRCRARPHPDLHPARAGGLPDPQRHPLDRRTASGRHGGSRPQTRPLRSTTGRVRDRRGRPLPPGPRERGS